MRQSYLYSSHRTLYFVPQPYLYSSHDTVSFVRQSYLYYPACIAYLFSKGYSYLRIQGSLYNAVLVLSIHLHYHNHISLSVLFHNHLVLLS